MPASTVPRSRPLLLLAALWLLAGGVEAQRAQYLPPGEFDLGLGSSYQAIDGALRNARWQVGKLFVDPVLAIRNVAYVSDFGSGLTLGAARRRREPDLTAGLAAGLRAYVPLGQRFAFAAHALPEYTWWQEASDRNRLNGRYGAGLFGGFGRSELELSLTRDEGLRFFSREFEERVNQRADRAELDFQIALVGAFSIYAGAGASEHELTREGQQELAALATNDREERRLRAGVRYRFVNGLQVGVGVEQLEAEFARDDARRFTSIDAVVVGLRHHRPRWGASVDVAIESVEVGRGASPVARDATRGRARLSRELGDRFGLQLYGDRNLVFSVQEGSPFFDDTRIGVALRSANLARFGFRLFAEDGRNEFASFDGASALRVDGYQAYGADLVLSFRLFQIRLGATTTDYDSNLDLFDRRVTTSRLNVIFGFSRGGVSIGSEGLRLGAGDLSPWV